MTSQLAFLDCPAYMDDEGEARCGLPAVVVYRYIAQSSDGPIESAVIVCSRGHRFNGPLEFLTFGKTPASQSGLIREP